jgi:uncharacterized membrane protein (DUF4010 family)
MHELLSAIDERLIGLVIAIGLGMLVGFERESAEGKPIGLRSFALIGAFGGLVALVPGGAGQWPLVGALIALGLLLAARVRQRQAKGLTTMIAALVMLAIGYVAVSGLWVYAIAAGGATMLVLHWKARMHGLVERFDDEDIEIVARFILLALVILPVMPNRTFGPYDVFNPFEAWTLVVLIVAINLLGYVALRLVGSGAGSWLAGLLGGMVSSTATTISYANLSKGISGFGASAALIILVASTVVYPRIAVELGVVAPGLVADVAWPAAVFSALLLALAGILHFRQDSRGTAQEALEEQTNPARIRAALAFAALYVLIIFAVEWARDFIGEQAVFGVAFVSGLTDVDALTLSVGQSFSRGQIGADNAWRAIFLASLSNLMFKTGAACVLGSAELRRVMLSFGGAAILAGFAIVLFWP